MTMTKQSINPLGLFVPALVAAAIILLALVVAAQPAYTTFKGANGLIAFESNQLTQNPEGDKEIFVMKPDGTALTNLTNNNAPDTAPAWSPDGQRIAFVSFRGNGSGEIYTMDANGADERQLTNDPAASDIDPTWSPDGTQIAWSNGDIRIMNANGTGQARLTSGSEHDSAPAWSPDGSQIAFAGSRPTADSQGSEIYVIRPDGTGFANLSKAPGDDDQPNWSPDGSRIAFQSNRAGSFHIYKMNADGSGVPTQLTNTPPNPFHRGIYDFAPSWSPDGTKIVFEANRTMSNGMFLNNEIYVMDADDGDPQTNLTNTDDGVRNFTPDWQPVDNTGPAAVGSFAATTGNREISLSWANPSDPDFKFTRILRSTVGFATGPDPTTEQVQVYEGSTTSHIDAGLANGTTYYYTAFARDSAGNWSTATTTSATPVPSDASPPITTATTSPDPNIAGWHKEDVTLELIADDGQSGSGVKETYYRVGTSGEYKLYDAYDKLSVSSEGITEITFYSTDNAGNAEETKTFTVKIDKTAPVVHDLGPVSAANDAGWYNSPVGNRFFAADTLSGLPEAMENPFVKTSGGTEEGTNVMVVSGQVADVAGNVAQGIQAGPFKVDLTKPDLNVSAPANGAEVEFSAGMPTPTFAPTDALSGIASKSDQLTRPQTASGVGTYTYKAEATDLAGNTSTEVRTFKVIYGSAYGGVLQPIDKDGSSNFKLGSTIPVKFLLLRPDGTPIGNAVARLQVHKAGTVSGAVNEAVSTAAASAGNEFRYDLTSGHYLFNLSTKASYVYTNPGGQQVQLGEGKWTLTITLDDGTSRSVDIDIRK